MDSLHNKNILLFPVYIKFPLNSCIKLSLHFMMKKLKHSKTQNKLDEIITFLFCQLELSDEDSSLADFLSHATLLSTQCS